MHQNVKRAVHGALALFIFALSGYAQDNPNAAPSSAAAASRAAGVPRMIRFAGALRDQSGEPLTGSVTVKFSLYELQSGESPLWAETQDLTLDAQGRYAVLLGAASPNGLPLDIFTSGKALWLGVEPQVPGLGEQPRGLLVAVPYALKAVDADTLGGKPASAYVQTDQAAAGSANLAAEARASGIAAGQGGKSKDQLAFQAGPQSGNFLPCTTLTSDGTLLTNVLPKYSSIGCQLTASAITESGGRVGIGTANPAAALEVSGTAKFDQLASLSGGVLTPNGTATPSAGANSNPLDLQALSYRSTDGHTGTMYFRWLAEPTGNNTSTPAAKLSLQFSSWGGSPFETGLSIAPNGAITFANSQQFPNVMNATGPAPEQTLFGDNGAMQFGLNQPVNEGFFIAIVDDPAGGRVSDAFVIVPNSSTATLASSVGAGATSLSLSKPLPLGAYSGLLIGTNTAKNQEVLKVASGGGTAVQTVSPTKYAHASGSLVTTLADRGDPPTLYLNGNTLVERPYNNGSGPGNYGNALKVSSQLVHPTVFPNLDYGQLHVQQTGPAAHANLAKLTFGTSNCAGACGAIGLAAAGAGSSMYLGTSNNYSAGVTNTALTIDPSGHVGFGTTTPSATLEVNGAAKFDQAVTAAGNITAAKFIGDGSMLKNISIGISSNSSLYDSATPARKNPLGPPPTACTAQAHGAGNLTGVYQWAYAESDASGVTTLSPAVTFTASNNTVQVSCPLPRRGVSGAHYYRTKAGGSTFYLDHQLGGGYFQTTFNDNVPDSSLGSQAPTVDTTGTATLHLTNTVKTFYTNPNDAPGATAADITVLTGNPSIPGSFSMDVYGEIMDRCGPGTCYNAQATGTGIGNAYSATWADSVDGDPYKTDWYIDRYGHEVINNPPMYDQGGTGIAAQTIAATLPATTTAPNTGVKMIISGAGTSAYEQDGMTLVMGSGYQGTANTSALVAVNSTNTTGGRHTNINATSGAGARFNSLFWGHNNPGALASLGAFSGTQAPEICFFCYAAAAGGNFNYASSSRQPLQFYMDTSGLLHFSKAAPGQADSPITFSDIMTLSGTGLSDTVLTVGNTAGSGEIHGNGDGLQINSASRPVQIQTGGTTRIYADTAGNVGIGTLNPSTALEVNGTAKLDQLEVSGTARFNQPVTFAAGQTFPGSGGVAAAIVNQATNACVLSNGNAAATCDASLSNVQQINPVGGTNITTVTITNLKAGYHMDLIVCQDATGGSTVAFPASMHGAMTVGTTAGKCSAQSFVSPDGTSLYALSAGVTNQ